MQEIEEMFRHQLMQMEQDGATATALNRRADQLGLMYDLLENQLHGNSHRANRTHINETYQCVVECFMEKIRNIYEDESIPPEQARTTIERTRAKLRRTRRILETIPPDVL
ncbi:MAG: hypothetical protein R3202_05330 [Candidatus Competibacterales bacterium]|nr:hypothetical protein [Candidatus Competibacterales bacterium]